MSATMDPRERAAIVRDGLGVGIATGTYALSFGAVSVAAGLTVAQTCALSLLMFTGASQFALVGVVAAGGPPVSGALTALLLGTRNTLYGLRLAPLLAWQGWRRVGAAHLLIDESTAMAIVRDSTPAARVGFLTTGGSIFVLWNAFTLIGALAGTAIGDPRTYGLDAAVGAAFLALLWPRLRETTSRVVALAAAAVAMGLVPLTAAGVPVLAAAAVALLAGLLRPDRTGGGPLMWWAILAAALGCYLLKLAGLAVPSRVLDRPLVSRVADLVPVALLAALVAVQVFGEEQSLALDARAFGVGFGVVLLLLRAPFLVVVFGAALAAALLRLL